MTATPRFQRSNHGQLERLLIEERYLPHPRREHPEDTPQAQAARRAELKRATRKPARS